ncbi:MAG: hypothetical protein ACYSTW_09170, partial [Planctomycetota bacterium]
MIQAQVLGRINGGGSYFHQKGQRKYLFIFRFWTGFALVRLCHGLGGKRLCFGYAIMGQRACQDRRCSIRLGLLGPAYRLWFGRCFVRTVVAAIGCH